MTLEFSAGSGRHDVVGTNSIYIRGFVGSDRKDLFDQYGIAVPKTFDEVEAAVKTVKEKSNGEIVGITMRGQRGIQGVYIWASYLGGMVGSFLTDEGKSALDMAEAAAALEAFARVLREYGPGRVAKMGWEENRLLFQQGKSCHDDGCDGKRRV